MTVAVDEKKAHLAGIIDKFEQSAPFSRLCEKLQSPKSRELTVTGLAGSAGAILLASLAEKTDRTVIAVVSDIDEANDLYDDLVFLLGEEKVGHFPSRQTPPYEFRSPPAENTGQRLSTLSRLISDTVRIVVAPIHAVIEPTITLNDFEQARLYLKVGDAVEINALAERLAVMGFRRVALVEEIGDFALRGGLVDFFSPGFDHPVRVEFFGDEIDTIRQFDVGSQRTTRRLQEVDLLPRREVPITQESLESYLECLPEADADLVRARFLNDPELPGLEWLAHGLGLEFGGLTDFVPDNALFCLAGEGNLKAEAEDIIEITRRHYNRMAQRLTHLPSLEEYYRNREKLWDFLSDKPRIDIVPFKGGKHDIIDFECREHPALGSRLDLLAAAISGFELGGMQYFIAADNPAQASRLHELLVDKIGVNTVIPIEVALLKGGFVCQKNKIAILTDHQIFGRYFRRTRRKKFKEGVAIHSYTSLSRGDFVVHTEHGIAQYRGLETIQVNERLRDCLLLVYAGGDKLYVPIEEFNRVSRYAGKDAAPKLSALGGTGWEKIKARTKKAIADMAADLLKIYAERKTRPGIAFRPDTTWMKQLEASFIYEETADQLKAVEAIKTDMEKPIPMDRLVCGDVGYGKTEVAVRAAFKAIESDHQVAVLVPTTILAQQHLTTFTERLSSFPVKIEMLSRFRTRKEQQVILKELADGKVDIVIGTHRLLSEDVQFASLGLLIVDEEQRFGVKHKETLRRIKATVDTITLTATPIPRTLHMSLMGVRDMSLINTSPKDRLPIVTEIREFEPQGIAEAILKEVDRSGQIFFVHNRVQTIEAMYRYLKKLVPQVEIAIAHGQMHERSLEGIMLAFLAGRFQVLLTTTIIESGLDIPTVNTIIISRADRFGLAQLYQLRGRVGRSVRRAYAHLMTPPYRLLTDDARKRLRAIEAHTELGSGFALAMKDLEIRGAGNILGAQQSGFIEEVGFDLYTRLLEEAVAELKGEEVVGTPDTRLEADLDLYLPDDYIDIRQQKVEIYQKIAGARNLDEIERIREDIEDRFGKLPQTAANLFEAAAVRVSAWANGIEKVRLKSGQVELFFDQSRTFQRRDIESWRRAVTRPMEFSLTGAPIIRIDLGQVKNTERLSYLRAILNRV
ncbi:MAG: transcription-repair coupling factor [Candidatus Zixiibacteriota bacterium]|nr:MAG: transcription-repair coupling factor [candidate division Zixibacteria bacterium]